MHYSNVCTHYLLADISWTNQPPPTEKGNRTTLHYVMKNDITCDLVAVTHLPVLISMYHLQALAGNHIHLLLLFKRELGRYNAVTRYTHMIH